MLSSSNGLDGLESTHAREDGASHCRNRTMLDKVLTQLEGKEFVV